MRGWDDAHLLIVEHDDEDVPLDEGMEHLDLYVVGDDEDYDGDSIDSSGDDGSDGGRRW